MNLISGHPSESSTRNQEIRELVSRASRVIAHYWPMSTFVHHNPLHGLESIPFEEAVRLGRRFVGGNGYLPNDSYREYVRSGRIRSEHLEAALRPIAQDQQVTLGDRTVSHFDVLRAQLLSGNKAPADEMLDAFVDRSPHAKLLRSLADRLAPVLKPRDEEPSLLGRSLTLAAWCDRTLHTQLTDPINRELIKWCEAFLDEGHAVWSMPDREQGFYQAWKSLAAREWSPCGISRSGLKIRALPAAAVDALNEHLDVLGIPEELRQDYLSLHLADLCGWASFINWRSELSVGYEWQEAHPIDLVQYLAVRLWYERELIEQACRIELGTEGTFQAIASWIHHEQNPSDGEGRAHAAQLAAAVRLHDLACALDIAPTGLTDATPDRLQTLLDWIEAFPEDEHGPVWLKAFEAGYQEDLLSEIASSVAGSQDATRTQSRPDAQAMFCIDVRSEPLRRNLEAVGNYQTIGFAGFFTVFIRHQAHGSHHLTDQYPVIAKASNTVHELARDNQDKLLAQHEAGKGFFHTTHDLLHDLKGHVLTPYILVESVGWLFGVQLFGRTLFPRWYRKCHERVSAMVAPPVATNETIDEVTRKEGIKLGFTLNEQVSMLETALRTLGQIRNFARLVLVCGHESSSDNNPFEAALDCGACGGNSGKPNARVFSAIANKPEVRAQLAEKGIVIPEDTHFIAGIHDTTTDAIVIFDQQDIPVTHQGDMERLAEGLHQAAVRTNQERCARLPFVKNNLTPAMFTREIERRAGDWSEVRPEWGLSGNAAFIVASRELTRQIDLKGRAFLHNYDYRGDSTGELLQGVLAGPGVVGQWINGEHYFSATDPEVYGSGSKIYHNVVGRFGIMAGPQSDLRTGLARQSVMKQTMPYHEPLRLLVVIEAPRERIGQVLQRLPHIQQVLDNEWIHLVAVDREAENRLYRYEPKQKWTSIA